MAASENTLFLSGDVMTGRGIDQILGHPGDPRLHEPYVRSAPTYVEIAERAAGPIPRRVDPTYVWGDALAVLAQAQPTARIINLETAITARGAPCADKDIHYRMHPANVAVIGAAAIDCCVLANNHVLDWGREGLVDTLATLCSSGIQCSGAGVNAASARQPAVISDSGGQRVLVFGCATPDSGVPLDWAALDDRPGVNVVWEPAERAADGLLRQIGACALPGDLVVVSIHWGSNWGYQIGRGHQAFARRLIDSGLVHAVHGHSSHHPRPIEIYRGCPILYGCGDLINDYEGIGGHESYRPGLALLYFPTFEVSPPRLRDLRMVPLRMRRFRLERASAEEARWLADTLGAVSDELGVRVELGSAGDLLAFPG